ncbi:MAG: M23 family metallopeptidase [Treponema sp.]|nr:M23 family metallopeptidase [Treponema sp.]
MKQIFLICLILEVVSAAAAYPVIKQLDGKEDDKFKQYTADVQESRKRVLNQSKPIDPQSEAAKLVIYEYKLGANRDLQNIAARCVVFESSIATLNRIMHRSEIADRDVLLLPTIPGLFVPCDVESSKSELEKLMLNARIGDKNAKIITVGSEQFLFFPGKDFNATEKAFFLYPIEKKEKGGFRYPLRYFTVTSAFGVRRNPVTGNMNNHNGLDLAAPMGTQVFAAQDGIVTEIGNDAVYGNYVVVRHEGNWASLYGHLSRVETARRASVRVGDPIGRVGSTGQSTGPHLHFELRQNGKAQDPGKLLFRRSE